MTTHKAAILLMLQRNPDYGVCRDEIYEATYTMRAAARIDDLKNEGHVIDSMRCETHGRHHARYWLITNDEPTLF